MREIKYRAWDKLKKIMVTKENVNKLIEKFDDFEDENEPYTRKELWPAYQIKGIFDYFDDIQHYNPFYESDMKDRFELMQYTGLKDENGKEIYEGDIVEITRQCIYEKGQIIFKNGCFFIKSKENSLGLYNCELNNYQLKVIGNLYNNPELLEE